MPQASAFLEDRYRLGPELGRGGFGVVYRGFPLSGGDPVAVKIAFQPPVGEELRRLAREVELMHGLRHPGLVPLLDCLADRQGRVALVYVLAPGRSLEAVLRDTGPFSAEPGLALVEDIGAALEYLHGAGLLHRDLKPGNIQLGEGGRARLLDFGLLRPSSGGTVTATGVLLGTPGFMAPELFEGAPASLSSERYAFAAVLWQVFAGEVPFPGDLTAVLAAQSRGPARPAVPGPAWSPGLERCLRGALAPRPEHRPPSLEALLGEIRVALRGGERAPVAPTLVVAEGDPGPRRVPPTPAPSSPAREVDGAPGGISLPRGLVVGALLLSGIAWGLSGSRGGTRAGNGSALPGGGSGFPASGGPRAPTVLPASIRELPEAFRSQLEAATLLRVTPEGEVRDVEDPAARVVGARPLVTPDPLRMGEILEHLPAARTLFDWIADQTILPDFPESFREELARCDARLEQEELPPLLAPLGGRPHGSPVEIGGEHYPADLEELHEELEGWAARAALSWRSLNAHGDRLSELSRAHDYRTMPARLRNELERDPLGRSFDLYILGETVIHDPLLRRDLGLWHGEGKRAARDFFFALGRCLREEPEVAPTVSLGFLRGFREILPFMFSELAVLEPHQLLGIRPESPWERLVEARLVFLTHSPRRFGKVAYQSAWDRASALWRELLEEDLIHPLRDRLRSLAGANLMRRLVEVRDHPAAASLARELWEEMPRYRIRDRASLAHQIVEVLHRAPGVLVLPRSDLVKLKEWLQDAEPDLPIRLSGSSWERVMGQLRELLAALPEE